MLFYENHEEKNNKNLGTNNEKIDNSSKIIANEVFFLKDAINKLNLKIDIKNKDKNDDCEDKKPCNSITVSQKLL